MYAITVIDLLGISRNKLKNVERMQVIVFGIEIDILRYIVKLCSKKLIRIVKATIKS